ncbi:hypothetical protein IE81DRAFT_240081 [Ceraceosorus guamensis]|uniref:Uncharacterized protein n=1 Tax=Ceraceosorus guamensis TaxID=1522189 RepID=A0A316W5D3_9BASI|nr:hypothetical protein IE81DRAFT_240081 [Ceraceosorus guamensis]PWN44834.1 hypothetical protein IE81DRAFT_240081 [Ceraceosorus guamensis]
MSTASRSFSCTVPSIRNRYAICALTLLYHSASCAFRALHAETRYKMMDVSQWVERVAAKSGAVCALMRRYGTHACILWVRAHPPTFRTGMASRGWLDCVTAEKGIASQS